eukprot:scaffold73062_cov63-Phaeocystis_antarctica.AAC.3
MELCAHLPRAISLRLRCWSTHPLRQSHLSDRANPSAHTKTRYVWPFPGWPDQRHNRSLVSIDSLHQRAPRAPGHRTTPTRRVATLESEDEARTHC